MLRRAIAIAVLLLSSCDSEADELGVGAQCTSDDQCEELEPPIRCLTVFKGGYCGLTGCQADTDCPESSFCVRHEDGQNYCFRACADKPECNVNRDVENEANCSANIDRVGGGNQKACVPPSSGT